MIYEMTSDLRSKSSLKVNNKSCLICLLFGSFCADADISNYFLLNKLFIDLKLFKIKFVKNLDIFDHFYASQICERNQN
jgi:hypothetical protein